MKQNKSRATACFLIICTMLLLTVLVSGTNSTATDPLISLSYLNGTFRSQIVSYVQSLITTQSEALETKMSQRIADVQTAAAEAEAAPTHSTATIQAGMTYSVPANGEFLFRSGSAAAQGAGLTDVTDGVSVAIGQELAVNHLYLASARVNLKASKTAVILIRK